MNLYSYHSKPESLNYYKELGYNMTVDGYIEFSERDPDKIKNDWPTYHWPDGKKMWTRDNLKHRDGNKPAVIFPNGEEYYYDYGNLTRVINPRER